MLRVSLLGSFSIVGAEPVSLRNKKAQALIAFLSLSPGPHARERLATLLWPDSSEEAARQSLRQCVSELRRVLADLPLKIDHDTLEMETDVLGSDVWELRQALADPSVDNLQRAAELYRDHLLEGFNARSDLFEEWVIGERARLRASAISAFQVLFNELQARNARDAAIALGLRLLALDPLQEDVDRALMRLYLQSGQTALAIRQYKRCEAVLRKELSVEPDQETKALYQEVLRHRSRRVPPSESSVKKSPSTGQARAIRQTVSTCVAQDGVRLAYAVSGGDLPWSRRPIGSITSSSTSPVRSGATGSRASAATIRSCAMMRGARDCPTGMSSISPSIRSFAISKRSWMPRASIGFRCWVFRKDAPSRLPMRPSIRIG
jgi:DNA-binding SARP family transcriptional activator